MKKLAGDLQLDLTAVITDVPQANSLPLFIRLMESLAHHHLNAEALAVELDVEVRTVHYYVDFGRWLRFILPGTQAPFGLTDTGITFAESIASRGRLFSAALFARRLVQTVHALKRDALQAGAGELTTLDACQQAIARMTELAPSTVGRRASALASMLESAYTPDAIDWTTGLVLASHRGVPFEFVGHSFLTAMAVRQFALQKTFQIAFPRQVRAFVDDRGQGLVPASWLRASYETNAGQTLWFGSVPLNASTILVAERRGRDLRRLLTVCAPFVTLCVAMLTLRDAAKRPLVHLTGDMYGLQLWHRDRVLGDPMIVLSRYAQFLDLEVVTSVPSSRGRTPNESLAMGTNEDLVAVLVTSAVVRLKNTTYELSPGFDDELREGFDELPSIADRLALVQTRLAEFLRAF
ncbi:MAG: hypothetical protein H0U74_13510 [Bradymonadaceae bacterium]|nr:hypothetical protein [Lujinxingiaceae bacterium]